MARATKATKSSKNDFIKNGERNASNGLIFQESVSFYADVIRAHHAAKLAVLLSGSSGFGKTQTVLAAAKELGFQCVDVRMSYRDPLSLFLPIIESQKNGTKVMDYVLSDFLNCLFTASVPTVIFLDEVTNPSSPEVFNVLKELLGERTILGKHISDEVVFVAASNFTEEDVGVRELPDSLVKRLTNLVFAPTPSAIVQHLPILTKEFFGNVERQNLLRKPYIPSETAIQDAVPRQLSACEQLFTAGLRGDALRACLVGRVGSSVGIPLADFFMESLHRKEGKGLMSGGKVYNLPAKLTRAKDIDVTVYDEDEMPEPTTKGAIGILKEMEADGKVIEIVAYLDKPEHDKDVVAYYLGLHASPEVVRHVFDKDQQVGFWPIRHGDWDPEGHWKNDVPWPLRAWERYALTLGPEPSDEEFWAMRQAKGKAVLGRVPEGTK